MRNMSGEDRDPGTPHTDDSSTSAADHSVSRLPDPDEELELINEYISEDKGLRQILPGPPPPPFSLLETVTTSQLIPRSTKAVGSPQPQPIRNTILSHHSIGQVVTGEAGMKHRSGASQPPQLVARCTALRSGSRRLFQREGSALSCGDTGTRGLEDFLNLPKLLITEQPKQRGMRFRYECEGRSAGSILGELSSELNKTLPSIEIQGCIQQVKKVKVTVSLVSRDIPYRPHPHSLVGKDCEDGICVVSFSPRTNRKHSFSNLGIQCVRRREVRPALEKRRSQGIDPFNTAQSRSFDDVEMNVVRLCFQCEVLFDSGKKNNLTPVVSEPVFDKKATTTSELKINRLNTSRGPCSGKTEIYLLCDKVQKDDIEVIFSLEGWEAKAEFAQTDVHRQIAIVFKAPPFNELDITEEVEVNMQLRRITDQMESEPVKYTYLPENQDPYDVNRKRKIAQSKLKVEIDDTEQTSHLPGNFPARQPPNHLPNTTFLEDAFFNGFLDEPTLQLGDNLTPESDLPSLTVLENHEMHDYNDNQLGGENNMGLTATMNMCIHALGKTNDFFSQQLGYFDPSVQSPPVMDHQFQACPSFNLSMNGNSELGLGQGRFAGFLEQKHKQTSHLPGNFPARQPPNHLPNTTFLEDAFFSGFLDEPTLQPGDNLTPESDLPSWTFLENYEAGLQ
ncbi:transcription factor RelB homolog [Polyodon spathula]|uniref:transcription factor RelB homolog n=1 Tax=Polyodon spathula TaxID=7913 RepID=UPI001B7E4831|nr:transcription factor RelB homolog [Polyodon spathula]